MLVHWSENAKVLGKVFAHLPSSDRQVAAQVCRKWKQVAYNSSLWCEVTPVYDCYTWHDDVIGRSLFFKSLEDKCCTSLMMVGATDDDVADFVNNFPPSHKNIETFALCRSSVTDTGLAHLLTHMEGLSELSIKYCNYISDSALYVCLKERLVRLSIEDCHHVCEDSVAAISQLLPNLKELNLQSFEISDIAMTYFCPRQSESISICRITCCMHLTNQGVVNLVNSLPNLTVVSLSSCIKITDDAIEILAEKLTSLTSLDLSWCMKVGNGALEAVAKHSQHLKVLMLDRLDK